MAKIKISGYQELISVPKEDAKRLREMKQDSRNKDQYVTAGPFSGQLKDVKAIILTQDWSSGVDKEHKRRYEEYYDKREELLSLSEEERAKKVTWPHFSLFFWGLKKKKPPEGVKDDVIKKVTEFFKKNRYRTLPSLKCYYELFPDFQSLGMGRMAVEVLFNIEERQLIEAEESEKFYEGDINPHDIF